eukprot:2653979-Pyramimonas_sp.AAC.1
MIRRGDQEDRGQGRGKLMGWKARRTRSKGIRIMRMKEEPDEEEKKKLDFGKYMDEGIGGRDGRTYAE